MSSASRQAAMARFRITGVPQDDRRDEEVQAGSAMLLIFVGAGANFPKPVDEETARARLLRDSPV